VKKKHLFHILLAMYHQRLPKIKKIRIGQPNPATIIYHNY